MNYELGKPRGNVGTSRKDPKAPSLSSAWFIPVFGSLREPFFGVRSDGLTVLPSGPRSYERSYESPKPQNTYQPTA